MDVGNVISTKKAYETLIGPVMAKTVPENILINEMIKAGIEFCALAGQLIDA